MAGAPEHWNLQPYGGGRHPISNSCHPNLSELLQHVWGHLSLCLFLTLLVNLQVYFKDEETAELYQVSAGSTLLQVLQHPR